MNKYSQAGLSYFALLFLALFVSAGCTSDDHRLAELADETSQRQAEQNREMARLNREVAEGSKRLVETVAQTSRDTTALQRELQTERRELAAEHRHESLLATVFMNVGRVLICLLPLMVCLYLFRTLGSETTEQGIIEVLIDEAALDRPRRLRDPRNDTALEHCGNPTGYLAKESSHSRSLDHSGEESP